MIDEMVKLYLGFEIESQHLFEVPMLSRAKRKKKRKTQQHENNNKHCKLMLFTLSHVVCSALNLVWYGLVWFDSVMCIEWSWSCFVICMGVRKAFTTDILHYRLAV